MNIEQYRALKAEEQNPTPEVVEPEVVQPTEVITEPTVEPEVPTEPKTPAVPQTITIEGVGEVPIDELKNGYLRQADYTKKTQEISHQKKEIDEAVKVYEQLKNNPALADVVNRNVAQPSAPLNPIEARIMEVESKMYDMLLQKDIELMQVRHPDFEVREVLQTAQEKGITNLEDAYFLTKARKGGLQPTPAVKEVDADALKEQLRLEILKELEAEGKATKTLVSSGGGGSVVTNNEPQLSAQEAKVARMMSLSPTEYAKWRDANKR